ncbi:MAG: hypothetical protein A3I75_07095 [Deltaproteobacteria bacterium RIFCSPLOWO2_02_FULL_50_16]|nr:MAG: hypothetical protein A2053_04765 [Deltaproteobacteria bacterium GWA2_50_8]OGQ26063.1 MAG: hypothetical protein A3B79_03375 [Deltaproteobacteria bacterium RIFCSPHIGHO2_02_FULL_50_15]OGQ56488.1 MAG: hypothetical protein A3I75_07095 [Deltaproteobacteria bacterium RIFCSPLOWO2_02_FULL_50_16]OGQ65752.1 MAG: hypothetical protein A3F89_05030 [Deltaproteobacteria bacterium RIFCSPLOWO2_12_FULL_50_11]
MVAKEKEVLATTKDMSIHYPAVEKLIDGEDFTKVNKNFTSAYKELEKISHETGLGRASQARKAMVALEWVMDLFREILKLKYRLMKLQEEGSPSVKK